jgi:exopolyphosphatase/guanosine-5'-triphosphate,3'-diphosphate pyrophosphatase
VKELPDPSDPHRPVAAVDLGTVSTSLLVTDGVTRHRRTVDTNIGGASLTTTGEIRPAAISDEALARVEAALLGFEPLLTSCGAVSVVATAGARWATNREQLVAMVERVLGVDLAIISPETEARLSYLGAVSDPASLGSAISEGEVITLDIGGGSTELAVGTWDRHQASCSVPVGGSLLTEAYLHGDPPRAEELSAALSVVELHVEDIKRELPPLGAALGSGTVVGLGAITTVAAIEVGYGGGDDRAETGVGNGTGDGPLHGFELTREAAEDVFRTVATENRADRAHNPGLPRTRVDDIVGGCAVLVEVLRQLEIDRLVVSQRGLLDGVVRELDSGRRRGGDHEVTRHVGARNLTESGHADG